MKYRAPMYSIYDTPREIIKYKGAVKGIVITDFLSFAVPEDMNPIYYMQLGEYYTQYIEEKFEKILKQLEKELR